MKITLEQADRLQDASDALTASAEAVLMTAMKDWDYSPNRRAGLAAAVSQVHDAAHELLPALTVAELDALPEGSVVVTGGGKLGPGYVRQKHQGRWVSWMDRGGCTTSTLLDPEHSSQPVRILHVPGGAL